MIGAEEQTAAVFSAVRIATADVGQATMNLSPAARVIARRGHAVADIALPLVVVTD
jgi:hypothetical protein